MIVFGFGSVELLNIRGKVSLRVFLDLSSFDGYGII